MSKNTHSGVWKIATNRQAKFNYTILESMECGIVLTGNEVKSVRAGEVNLKDSWCDIESDGQLVVKQMYIANFDKGSFSNVDTMRKRVLLAHRREIRYLLNKIKQDGITLVPLSLYFKGAVAKLELGVAKGKKLYDKRADAAKKDAQRSIERALKS
jgi:SsrA-binding protein